MYFTYTVNEKKCLISFHINNINDLVYPPLSYQIWYTYLWEPREGFNI